MNEERWVEMVGNVYEMLSHLEHLAPADPHSEVIQKAMRALDELPEATSQHEG